MPSFFKQKDILLRLAIAFAFLYPAIDGLIHPDNWIDFFPSFMRGGFLSDPTLLLIWGAIEAVIALWILSGKKIFWPSTAATILLCGIVFFNMSLFDLVFRDLAIALTAATLAWYHYRD
jgi:hypothetical protein